MKVHNALASIATLFFLTAASFAQQVKTDYDRSVNFDQYKTYTWEKVQTQDPLWVDRIKSAVDADLTTKGWRLALGRVRRRDYDNRHLPGRYPGARYVRYADEEIGVAKLGQ